MKTLLKLRISFIFLLTLLVVTATVEAQTTTLLNGQSNLNNYPNTRLQGVVISSVESITSASNAAAIIVQGYYYTPGSSVVKSSFPISILLGGSSGSVTECLSSLQFMMLANNQNPGQQKALVYGTLSNFASNDTQSALIFSNIGACQVTSGTLGTFDYNIGNRRNTTKVKVP